MIDDADDDEGPRVEIAPGVYVRPVSDEYAAAMMGITPAKLRQMRDDAASGAVRTYTLDEVIEEMKKDDPHFEAALDAERAKRRRRMS